MIVIAWLVGAIVGAVALYVIIRLAVSAGIRDAAGRDARPPAPALVERELVHAVPTPENPRPNSAAVRDMIRAAKPAR